MECGSLEVGIARGFAVVAVDRGRLKKFARPDVEIVPD
jgi:hypothetical protein